MGVIVAVALVTSISLFYFHLSIDLLLLVVIVSLAAIYIGGLPAYKVVFAAILLSILLNVANYTFLQYSFEGEQVGGSTESRFLVLLRLPLVFYAFFLVLSKHSAEFMTFLKRNSDAVLFAVLPYCSLLFSIEFITALQYAVWFSFSLLTILAFLFLLGTKVPHYLWSEHVAWLLMAGYIIVTLFVVIAMPSYVGGVLASAYSPTNFYAYASPIILATILVLDRQRRIPGRRLVNRIPYWSLLLLGLVNIVPLLWSAKRSALVATGLIFLVYAVTNRSASFGKRSSSLLRTAMIAAVVAAAVWLAIPRMETTIMRFERIFDPAIEDRSVEARRDVWRTSVAVVAEQSPVFGVGLRNGPMATKEFAGVEEGAGFGLHSTLIAIFIEMGGVGLLLFFIVSLRSLRLWFACPKVLKWNIAIFGIPAVLISLTEYNLIPGQAVFWPLWISVLLPRVLLAPVSENTDVVASR